jgi:UDP-GlcNAc:undecaprenyl-phosphate GlcNAc-1-phosphate transferase
MMTGNLIAFISAVIISFVMTPWARKLAIKVGALDIPKESRKIHNKPMPYFGGLAIYVSIIACMFVYMPHTSIPYSSNSLIISITFVFLTSGIRFFG